MLNLAIVLEGTARELPDRPAVRQGNTTLTYSQLDAASSRVANALISAGLVKGDRIAVSCPNVPYFPIVYFGILKAGGVVVPLNILLTEREIAYHLADSGAKAYFCFEGTADLPIGRAGAAAFDATESCEHFILLADKTFAEFIHRQPATCRAANTEATDAAVILYTSGTTGRAKGAQLTHSNMVQNAQLAGRLFGTHPHDVHLIALPLFHSFGQSVQMNAGLANGATLVLMPRFSAEAALTLMDKHQVTFFAGVPTMYHALLGSESDAGLKLRVAVSGGAPLPGEIMRRFEERFAVPILEGYGLSETSPIATFNRVDRPRKEGSIGLPVWGVEVDVVDKEGKPAPDGEPGEIVIRGHNVMKGYLGRPEATKAAIDDDGWFRTGDIGTRDADGYFYVVDRKKDMIIRGGFNVYPRELEEVLLTHPDVSLAAVIGVPHDVYGEEIKAFVVPAKAAKVTEQELIAWCRQVMAAYKYPRLLEFRASLPMTATGKVLKRELAAQS
jgi:long-chain acyl-CoA synthetase